MNKLLLALLIGGTMVSPSAFAMEDPAAPRGVARQLTPQEAQQYAESSFSVTGTQLKTAFDNKEDIVIFGVRNFEGQSPRHFKVVFFHTTHDRPRLLSAEADARHSSNGKFSANHYFCDINPITQTPMGSGEGFSAQLQHVDAQGG